LTPREDRLVLNSSWSDLLSGIFIDVAKLLAQELELAKLKLQEELRQAKAYFALVILVGFIAAMGLLMMLLMAVFLLNADVKLPLWECFGIIGGVTFFVGGGLVIAAKVKKTKVDFVPQPSAEAVKEDFEWISSSIKTSKSGNKPAQH
jgi:Putative Actinobacterial Holin-X, holin superfamily III